MEKGCKRERTRYPGIYGVGNNYYITYRICKKKYEENAGPNLADAHEMKGEREAKGRRRGKHLAFHNQRKTTFKELLKLYGESEGKRYILQFKKAYEDFFGDLKLFQITRKDLFRFRDQLKGTPKQRGGQTVKNTHVNRALAGLRRLLHFAESRDLLEESMNPFPKSPKSGLFFSEKKGLRNYFTEAQMSKIIGAAPEWLKPMITTAYYTGMRMGEMLKLRWEHVNLDTGIIHLPSSKTLKDPSGVGQRIVMQRELVDLFKAFPKSGEWVFIRPNGLPYQHWDVHKPFKEILKLLEIDTTKFSWKEIRHTTGTLLHLKGADTLAIRDQLRHTTSQTTEHFYIGSDIEHQREQNELLTLNQEAKA